MAYSDNRWHEATTGRVYTKPYLADGAVLARLDVREAWNRNRRKARALGLLTDEPLVKPAAYKNLNASNGSGPSGVRS
jgi:hypothetical protein